MKPSDSNKSFDQEVNENLELLLKRIKDPSPQKVFISSWRGVDNILNNVSGVSIVSELGLPVASITLVQLDCDNGYLELAQTIREKATNRLTSDGFVVIIKSSI